MSVEQIESLLREIATQFGVAFEALWEVLVRQAYVSGITYAIALVALLVVAAYLLRASINLSRRAEYIRDNAEGGYWARKDALEEVDNLKENATVGFIISCILIAASIPVLHAILTRLLNPEFWAIEKLLKMMSRLG